MIPEIASISSILTAPLNVYHDFLIPSLLFAFLAAVLTLTRVRSSSFDLFCKSVCKIAASQKCASCDSNSSDCNRFPILIQPVSISAVMIERVVSEDNQRMFVGQSNTLEICFCDDEDDSTGCKKFARIDSEAIGFCFDGIGGSFSTLFRFDASMIRTQIR